MSIQPASHYPGSIGEFHAWFSTDADCLGYLEGLRWPQRFVCPECGHGSGWRMGDGRFRWEPCDCRTSVTAGTIFDRTRTPLTVSFTAYWLFATAKHDGRSERAARARGDDPHASLPAVHRVASLTERWLLGTHQGAVEATHLHSYLNEFVFRFNRRISPSRRMVFCRALELAVGHAPVRYADLVVNRRPR